MNTPGNPYDVWPYSEYGFRLMGRIIFDDDSMLRRVDISTGAEIEMRPVTGMMLFVTCGKYRLEPGTTMATADYNLAQRWKDLQTGRGDLYGDIYSVMKFWNEAGCDEYFYLSPLDASAVEAVYGELKATLLANPPKLEFD